MDAKLWDFKNLEASRIGMEEQTLVENEAAF
jgi:hypothetical protein